MPHDHDSVEIVHPGAPESAVGGREARRPDEMRFEAEAGAQAQNRCASERLGPCKTAAAALQPRWLAYLRSGGKGANKPPPDCVASGLPQVGSQRGRPPPDPLLPSPAAGRLGRGWSVRSAD